MNAHTCEKMHDDTSLKKEEKRKSPCSLKVYVEYT